MRGRWLTIVLCCAVAAVPTMVRAQTELESDPSRIFSIQPRQYRLGHEFQLGVGFLPLDAFYLGIVATAGYTYHITDFWAWEIAGGGYSFNIDTSLEDELFERFQVKPTDQAARGIERISMFATTSAIIKPLFGKLAIFNSDIVYSETFLAAGVGGLRLGSFWRPVVDIGLGLRFWSSQALSIRLDVRDYLVFTSFVPRQSLLIVLSAGLNYFDDGQSKPMREGVAP